MTTTQPRSDVYTRVTANIIADLEQGVRTWQRPWNAENAAGNIIRPRRANGLPQPWGECPAAVERSSRHGLQRAGVDDVQAGRDPGRTGAQR